MFSYKPGRVVVVLTGRNAGKKGIIIKSNYENSKDKKFPHCLVVGLAKAPKRVTKKSLKRVEDRVKNIESGKDQATVAAELQKLKRLGVFIKTYNMSHLLATRYKVEEDFGINTSIEKLDSIETDIKERQSAFNRKEQEKKEDNKSQLDQIKNELGGLKDQYKQTIREVKKSIGTELFNRFMRGFVRTRDNVEENEKIAHSEFLFKKLKF